MRMPVPTNSNGDNVNGKNESLYISDEVKKSFNTLMKKGIYKELYDKKLLTNEQLNSLLNK